MIASLATVVTAGLAGLLTFVAGRGLRPRPAGFVSREAADRIGATPGGAAGDPATIEPEATTGVALTVAATVLVVVGVSVGVLAFWIRRAGGALAPDRAVERWAHEVATPSSDAVLSAVTDLGATVTVIVLGVGVAAWVALRHRTPSAFAFLALVIGGQALLTNLIKDVVARARPALAPRSGFSGESFPSGHSATAIAGFLAFALVIAVTRSPRARVVLFSVAAAIGVAVATTRVLLGVHWLSDAVAGLAIGVSWYLVCAAAFGGRLLRFGAPLEPVDKGRAGSAAVRRPIGRAT